MTGASRDSLLHLSAELARREQQLVARGKMGDQGERMLPNKLQAIEASVNALTKEGIDYALIGGLAVGIRSGVPRATLDVDLAVPSHEDPDRLQQCLQRAGFRHHGTHAHSINFTHASGEPVQLAFDLEFDPMIERAELMRFGDLEVCVVTRDDLLVMKRRAAADPGRRKSKALRDLADIELLQGDVPDPNEGW